MWASEETDSRTVSWMFTLTTSSGSSLVFLHLKPQSQLALALAEPLLWSPRPLLGVWTQRISAALATWKALATLAFTGDGHYGMDDTGHRIKGTCAAYLWLLTSRPRLHGTCLCMLAEISDTPQSSVSLAFSCTRTHIHTHRHAHIYCPTPVSLCFCLCVCVCACAR